MKLKILLLTALVIYQYLGYAQMQNADFDGFLPDKSSYQVLVSKDNLPKENYTFFLDFTGTPSVLTDSLQINLTSKENNALPIIKQNPIKVIPDKLYCLTGGSIVFRENNRIKQYFSDSKEKIIQTQLEEVDVSSSFSNGVYAYGKNSLSKQHDLYYFDFNNNSKAKIFSNNKQITNATGNGEITLFSLDSIVYIITGNNAIPVLNVKNQINSIVMGAGGFFYSTNYEAGYFDINSEISFSFIYRGVKQLYVYENNLYLNSNDGTLSHISNIEFFKNLAEKISQSQPCKYTSEQKKVIAKAESSIENSKANPNNSGSYLQLINDCKEALNLAPVCNTLHIYYYFIGDAYSVLAQTQIEVKKKIEFYEQAINNFNQYVQLKPNDPDREDILQVVKSLESFREIAYNWDRIRNSKELSDFEIFANKYPNSEYADSVRIKTLYIYIDKALNCFAENKYKEAIDYLTLADEYQNDEEFKEKIDAMKEQITYYHALSLDDISYYEAYLNQYPNSEHKSFITQRLCFLYDKKIEYFNNNNLTNAENEIRDKKDRCGCIEKNYSFITKPLPSKNFSVGSKEEKEYYEYIIKNRDVTAARDYLKDYYGCPRGKYWLELYYWVIVTQDVFVLERAIANNSYYDLFAFFQKYHRHYSAYSVADLNSLEKVISKFLLSKIEMVFVEGGSMKIKREHDINVGSFFIGKYEITNEEYCVYLNTCALYNEWSKQRDAPEYLESTYDTDGRCAQIFEEDGIFYPKCGMEKFPVIWVDKSDAYRFCEWLGCRFPTEFEWEYAARGGKYSNSFTYAGSNKLKEVAWYRKNSGREKSACIYKNLGTHQVGLKKPNELGIYDMSGNVNEYCDRKIIKGGTWGYPRKKYFSPSYKETCHNCHSSCSTGFRICLDN